jgi:hypothetical protein
LATLTLTGCSPDGDPFDQAGFVPLNNTNKLIESYFSKDDVIENAASEPAKVFIDFSDGMLYAYQGNSNNSNILEAITHRLIAPEIKWFGLGGGKIYELGFQPTQLFNKVTDAKSYSKEIMAPIQETLEQITSGNGESLFVTDFEEYTPDKKEQFENFAKDYFIKWLQKGNSIDFIITDYQEKTRDKRAVTKHLYFTVFSTLGKKLLNDVKYSFEGRDFVYKAFSLSNKFYELYNKYPSASKGGNYHDENGEDIVCVTDESKYVNGLKKNGKYYEYYLFQSPWKDIVTNSNALKEEGVPKPFTALLRNLFIKVEQENSYLLQDVKIKVGDITDDYVLYSKANEALKHKPKLSKDEQSNTVFDPQETDPIALGCYTQDGQLMDCWKYSPQAAVEPEEIFDINRTIFQNSYKDDKAAVEISVTFHDNLEPPKADLLNGRLLRLDIVLECKPNLDGLEKENLFSWESITLRDKVNTSLSEAIRNTLDKFNPSGTIIYTYYIQTLY